MLVSWEDILTSLPSPFNKPDLAVLADTFGWVQEINYFSNEVFTATFAEHNQHVVMYWINTLKHKGALA